jgi:hypothetical protein
MTETEREGDEVLRQQSNNQLRDTIERDARYVGTTSKQRASISEGGAVNRSP